MGVAGWALTLFLVTLLLTVAILLAVGSYTRKETVPGVLQPTAGAARVTAFAPGVISRVFVEEGEIVEAGDPILELSSDRSVVGSDTSPTSLSDLVDRSAGREAEAIVQRAQALAAGSASALDDLRARREALRDDLAQLLESVELQEERVRLAQATLDAGRSLHERELFSTLQLRQREEALIAARQGLSSIEREIRRNQASLLQTEAEEGQLKARMAESLAQTALAQAQFDQRMAEHLAEHATVLVASRAGRVVALQARAGAPVQPGRALAIILPSTASLQAELWVPSRSAGFLKVGDRVRLMYDAFPYQKFGVGLGTVQSVAGAPTDPNDLPVPIETREALYRVIVHVDASAIKGYGRDWQLAPGMRLSADLVLDERSIWEWLLDPVIAARRRAGS